MICQTDGCMCQFGSVQEWCDHRNAVMPRKDLKWIVDATGKALLTDCPDWSVQRKAEIAKANEAERRKFNHRLNYPVTRDVGINRQEDR